VRRRWRAWRHRRLQARLAGPRLLRAFAEAYPEATFVEIGANDGEQHDHLREHVLRGGWRGVMVEPVPYVFARLERNYAGVPGVALERAAVGARDGRAMFFHLRDAGGEERRALPDWYDGVGSFDRETILRHAPQMPDVAERIVEAEVEVLAFETLCSRHGLGAIDLLVIDTEGHDWEVLRTIDLARRAPRLVVYEHFHLAPRDRAAARAHMEGQGYETMEEGFDTFCLHAADGDDGLARVWRRLRPAVPGVSKDDEVAA
jgi:FkbM family methyltransferase